MSIATSARPGKRGRSGFRRMGPRCAVTTWTGVPGTGRPSGSRSPRRTPAFQAALAGMTQPTTAPPERDTARMSRLAGARDECSVAMSSTAYIATTRASHG